MDYRIHRQFSRKIFNINAVLSLIYLLSLMALYLLLIREYKERYFIETNSGFIIPIEQFDLQKNNRKIAKQFFD